MTGNEKVVDVVDTEEQARDTSDFERIAEDLASVGRMWAHHGLTIGKMALKSSARTLEVTAGALETIATKIAPKESAPAAEEPPAKPA